jgi:hypothetical protein
MTEPSELQNEIEPPKTKAGLGKVWILIGFFYFSLLIMLIAGVILIGLNSGFINF